MKVRLDREMKNLVDDLLRGSRWIDDGKYQEAYELFLQGRAMALRLGLPYARIAWALCIAADGLGEVETAMKMALEAIDQDPLAPEYRHSFVIVASRIRSILEDPRRDPGDPSTPRLYRLLAENDQAEDGTHLAMARYLLHTGDIQGAMRLLEAVTTLSPAAKGAWELLAEAAALQGDEELAEDCAFHAIAWDFFQFSTFREKGLQRPPQLPV